MTDGQLCTYCNQLATTRDHIPPKLLFSRPWPSNLATVPACQACNQSFSADDEYARMVLISHHGASNHSTFEEQIERLKRALARPQGAGLKKLFLAPFVAAGVYNREQDQDEPVAVKFDLARVSRVVARTAIGLHRIHYSERLVPDYGAFAADLDAVAAMPDSVDWLRNDMIESINDVTATCVPLEWGKQTVVFAFGRSLNDARQSVWRFRFFGGAEFGVWTVPREVAVGINGAVYCAE